MQTKLIQHGSPEYEQMVKLRIEALLEPIGVSASYIDRENEKDDFFIGSFEDGQIIGCCILTPKDKHTVQLRQMAVRPDNQGKKIGRLIIAFAEEVASKKGFKILMMHARDAVIEFYRKCGYEIAGPKFFEVGMGHHKMQKVL
jgi:N-acetylglutamate synthase-like GNAT family acetyltransferase